MNDSNRRARDAAHQAKITAKLHATAAGQSASAMQARAATDRAAELTVATGQAAKRAASFTLLIAQIFTAWIVLCAFLVVVLPVLNAIDFSVVYATWIAMLSLIPAAAIGLLLRHRRRVRRLARKGWTNP